MTDSTSVPRARVAVLGSKGRLGAALVRLWSPDFEVIPLSREDVDLSHLGRMESVFRKISCDYVVNCAGLTNVDYCEEHPKEAVLLNATSPGLIAQVCAARGIRFIHFSTDYVFGGDCPGTLSEKDPAVPISEYGRSKLEGENIVLRASGTHVVLRVSWVFGPDKPSFVDGVLARALTQDRVEAVADKTASPTYTHDLSQWVRVFLKGGVDAGLYHLCNSGGCTWRDYGQYALDCALRRGISLKATTVAPLRLEDMRAFQARRPRYSVLSTEKFTNVYGSSLRPWKDAMWDYISLKFS